ncbi:MAG TPA: ATP-binding protein [Pseudonocardiaceae bacterium]
MKTGIRLDTYLGSEAMVVRPVGVLSAETYLRLRDGLLKCATEEPPAIVVDLDSMRAAVGSSLTVFTAVWNRISGWPGVPLVLASAQQPLRTMLDASGVPGFVPTCRSVGEALGALDAAPTRRKHHVELLGDPASVRLVRRLVEQTCHHWGIPELVTDAVLVASELTENMVRHARTDGWLRLELRGKALTVAVADANPHPPQLRAPDQRIGGGRGLVLVAALSRTWGIAPRAPAGKVVWAALSVPASVSTPKISVGSR